MFLAFFRGALRTACRTCQGKKRKQQTIDRCPKRGSLHELFSQGASVKAVILPLTPIDHMSSPGSISLIRLTLMIWQKERTWSGQRAPPRFFQASPVPPLLAWRVCCYCHVNSDGSPADWRPTFLVKQKYFLLYSKQKSLLGRLTGRAPLRERLAAVLLENPRSLATWSLTKLLHSAQEMGKGLRERWAAEKGRASGATRKRVIFGGPWGESELAA
jgi:hypothetical protein